MGSALAKAISTGDRPRGNMCWSFNRRRRVVSFRTSLFSPSTHNPARPSLARTLCSLRFLRLRASRREGPHGPGGGVDPRCPRGTR